MLRTSNSNWLDFSERAKQAFERGSRRHTLHNDVFFTRNGVNYCAETGTNGRAQVIYKAGPRMNSHGQLQWKMVYEAPVAKR